MNFGRCRIGFFWLGMTLGAAAGLATTLERISLEGLTTRADAVVHVRCLSSESRWERGEIWTWTHFEVSETLKGTVPRLLTVRLPGGRVGHLTSTIEAVPRFHAAEESILFLKRTPDDAFTVLSWAQGTFRIRSEPHTGRKFVMQDSAAVPILDYTTMQFRTEGIRNVQLGSFKERVSRLVRETAGAVRP